MILIGYFRALIWFKFTLNAAKNLHENSLWAVIHSPLSFFHANPTGRILNRFTRDQNQTDELLPFTMFDFIQCFLFYLGALVLVCVVIPYLLIVMPALIVIFIYARNKYIKISRELKRMEATTRSPIFADFSATLDGLTTLKAYNLQKEAIISFQRQLDRNSRVWFAFLLTSRWLCFRLDIESSFIVIAVAFVAVILKDSIDVVSC
jgi:ATP-binding cassette subfamily C (CFTR/MRP) protein 4